MKTKPERFSVVIERLFPDIPATTRVAKIHYDSGVGQDAIRKAARGLRIQPGTASRLAEWAWTTHGVAIDTTELVMAPTRAEARRLRGLAQN
jgi:hypothetical protein